MLKQSDKKALDVAWQCQHQSDTTPTHSSKCFIWKMTLLTTLSVFLP